MRIVLGRFQPLHFGHVHLIEEAMEEGELTIAIGSSQAAGCEMNPWTADERRQMIEAWLAGREAKIVFIEDINDPPNWVKHARKEHGEGILVTSDEETAILYRNEGFMVKMIDLSNRELLEGWRVRKTLTMLSTIGNDDAVREVMSELLPSEVIEWLIENDALFRLSVIAEELPYVG